MITRFRIYIREMSELRFSLLALLVYSNVMLWALVIVMIREFIY